jgi:hypothetical protein
MTSTRFDPFAQTTGGLVTQYMNTPLEPDDPRCQLAKGKPADVQMPREITVTGNGGSRPYLNKIDQETARVITRGRVRPHSSPLPDQQHERHEMTDETDNKPTYQEAVAELRRKFGYAPDADETGR